MDPKKTPSVPQHAQRGHRDARVDEVLLSEPVPLQHVGDLGARAGDVGVQVVAGGVLVRPEAGEAHGVLDLLVEKGGAKGHFAVYLVLEAPFSLGRGYGIFASKAQRLERAIPLIKGVLATLAACLMGAGSKGRALSAFAAGQNRSY